MTRFLVTGASGFIGRALVPALRRAGHHVRTTGRTSRPDFDHVAIQDLTDRDAWVPALAGVEVVVHLAGIAHVTDALDEDIYDRTNHRGTAALVQAARGVTHFIFVSSIRAQTGAVADHVLVESDPALPTDAYGRSKLAAEKVVASSGVPYSILRPVLVYGAELKGNLRSLQRMARIPLPFGALSNRRSLVALDNLIEAVLHLARRGPTNETFIVADPSPLPLPDLVAQLGRRPFWIPRGVVHVLARIAGGKSMWERIGGELVVDPAKLLATGWRPVVSTREGLARLRGTHA